MFVAYYNCLLGMCARYAQCMRLNTYALACVYTNCTQELAYDPKALSTLQIKTFAQITGAWTVEGPEIVDALHGFHVWSKVCGLVGLIQDWVLCKIRQAEQGQCIHLSGGAYLMGHDVWGPEKYTFANACSDQVLVAAPCIKMLRLA